MEACLHDLKEAPLSCEMNRKLEKDSQGMKKRVKLRQGEIYCLKCWMTSEEIKEDAMKK